MKRFFTRRSFNPTTIIDMLVNGEFKQYLGLILAIITAIGVLNGGNGSSAGTVPETPDTTQTTTTHTATRPAPTTTTQPPVTTTQPPASNGPFKLVDQQRPANGCTDETSVAFAGTAYPNSVATRGYHSGTYVEYNISNEYWALKTTIGIDDNAKVIHKYGILKFYLDGRLISEERAEFAKPRTISLDVSDATRLRVEFYAYDLTTNKAVGTTGVSLGTPNLYK